MKKYSYILFLILFAFFSLNLSAASRRGKRALTVEDYDRALSIFQRDIRRDPSNWEAHSLIGFIYFQEDHKDLPKALSHLRKAFEIKKDDPLTNMYLFTGYVMNENFNQAESILSFIDEKEIDNIDDNYLYYLYKGVLLFNQNKTGEAIEYIVKSIELEPICGICRKHLGLVYYDIGDYPNADATLSRAVGFFPDDYNINYALADIFLEENYFRPNSARLHIDKLKSISPDDDIDIILLEARLFKLSQNYRESLKLYQKAYNIDSSNCLVNLELADIYQRGDIKNLELSRKHMNFVLEHCSDLDNIHLELANYYKNIGQKDKAISEYQNHIEKNPEDFNAISRLAMLYLDRTVNKPEMAIQTAQKAIEINESFPTAIRILAISYFAVNDHNNAKKFINKALEINPNDSELLGYIAEINFNDKNYDQAKQYANRAIRVMPNNFRALKVLGEIAYYEKDFRNAVKYLENALSIRRNDYRAILLLAYAYQEEEVKDYRKSYQYAEKALEINPRDGNTWKLLGNAYLNDRLLSKALEAFENSLLYNPQDNWVRNQVSDLRRRLGKE